MSVEAILGVDIGSTGIKVSAYTKCGLPLRQKDGAHYATSVRVDTNYPSPGWVEQNPEQWWLGFQSASKALVEHLQHSMEDTVNFGAVALSGQMQDVVLVNQNTKSSVRAALLYSDIRAGEEARLAESLLGGADRIAGISGNYKGASSCLCKLLWLKHQEGKNLTETTSVLFGAHSFIAWKLTGRAACDYTTANTTGLLDVSTDGQPKWAKEQLLEPCGLGPWENKLPELLRESMTESLGRVSLSDITGESSHQGTLSVFHGAGDLATTTLGACAISNLLRQPLGAEPYLYVGTSGWIAKTVERKLEPSMQRGVFSILHPNPQYSIVAASMATASGNVEFIIRLFEDMLCEQGTHGLAYAKFEEQCLASTVGANKLLYLPHINGERSPVNHPFARGSFIGLSASHKPRDMMRACLEGVCFHFRWLAEALEVLPMKRAILVGGGGKSKLWRQLFADILDCTMVHLDVDPATLGAVAGTLDGVRISSEDALTFGYETSTPKQSHTKTYSRLYTIWRDAYIALTEVNEALAQTGQDN